MHHVLFWCSSNAPLYNAFTACDNVFTGYHFTFFCIDFNSRSGRCETTVALSTSKWNAPCCWTCCVREAKQNTFPLRSLSLGECQLILRQRARRAAQNRRASHYYGWWAFDDTLFCYCWSWYCLPCSLLSPLSDRRRTLEPQLVMRCAWHRLLSIFCQFTFFAPVKYAGSSGSTSSTSCHFTLTPVQLLPVNLSTTTDSLSFSNEIHARIHYQFTWRFNVEDFLEFKYLSEKGSLKNLRTEVGTAQR